MILPNYRAWVVVASLSICFTTWFVIEKTRLGAYLRAGTENPRLVEAFGVNVPLMITLTYGFGVALAAFAGVLAAPVIQVSPLMGQNLIIVVFAIVVIGGMGSIMGAILNELGLGVIEGLTKVVYPEASSTVVFVVMVIVLLIRPTGLFGREKGHATDAQRHEKNHPRCLRAIADSACLGTLRRRFPGVRDEADVLRAVRLGLQPATWLYRPAVLRPRGLSRRLGLRGRPCDAGLGPDARTRPGRRHAGRRPARLGLRPAGHPPPGDLLRDDHAGAGADGVLHSAPGQVHRRRGWSARRAARPAVRPDRPAQRHHDVLRVAGDRGRFLPTDRAHRAFAFWPGAQGHQGERAARALAGLRREPLQAAGLRDLGRAVGPRGLAQDAGAGLCHAVGRALERFGPGDPDDAGRRPGHAVGAAARRHRGGGAREQDRRLPARDHGRGDQLRTEVARPSNAARLTPGDPVPKRISG